MEQILYYSIHQVMNMTVKFIYDVVDDNDV